MCLKIKETVLIVLKLQNLGTYYILMPVTILCVYACARACVYLRMYIEIRIC